MILVSSVFHQRFNTMSPKVDLISTDNFVGFINVLNLLIGELYLTDQLTKINSSHISVSRTGWMFKCVREFFF